MPSSRSPWPTALPLTAVCAVVLGAGVAPGLGAPADDAAPPPVGPSRQAEIDRELESLGETLKAASLSGAISAAEAGEVWAVLAGRLVGNEPDGPSMEKRADRNAPRAGSFAAARIPPSADDLSPLFEPVIQRRDLRRLVQRLDLDADQETIVAVSIVDAGETLEAAAAPLLEAIRRFRRAATDRWIQDVLARAVVAPDELRLERLQRNLEAMGLSRKAPDPAAGPPAEPRRDAKDLWPDRMRTVTRELDGRLDAIRAAAAARLDTVEDGTAPLTDADIARLAAQLDADRRSLESGIAELLAAVTTESQRGSDGARLHAVLGDLRLARRLPAGRYAGESMDLAAALLDATPDAAADPSLVAAHRGVTAELAKSRGTLETMVDARSRTAVARALAAVAALTDADASPSTAKRGNRSFRIAVERELAASRAVRDLQLARLDAALGTLAANGADELAAAFRAEAWRRGFPSETQPTWSEAALAAAVDLDDVDALVHTELAALMAGAGAEAGAIRDTAVADRIRLGPAAVDTWIRTVLDGGPSKGGWPAGDPRTRLETAVEATDARRRVLDDRTESTLRALLAPDQFDQLPPRWGRRLATGKGTGEEGGKPGDWRSDPAARAAMLEALEQAVAAGKLTREEAATKAAALRGDRNPGGPGRD